MIRVPRLNHLPLTPATLGAGAAGVLALAMLAMPSALLEALVLRSGIASVIGAAEPPLGVTARVALALLLGGGAGAGLWIAATLMLGDADGDAVERVERPIPLLRRADAHPDAPARQPLFATQELGTPFLDVNAVAEPIERPLPADLDQPLAMFDPSAILPEPREPVYPVAPLARAPALEPGERLEVFPLETPPVTAPEPPAAPATTRSTEATIQSLLERLERGVRQREEVREAEKPASLTDTLSELRRMAVQR